MELPHMGEHCTEASCKRLDYLPMKCDACEQLYCKDHLLYDDHSCTSKYKKDIQVPVCPLCSAPVPYTRGTLPDLAVSAHIDQACQSKPKEKVFTNKCSKPRCKKKEFVKITCDGCRANFCFAHRHPNDHACEGAAGAGKRAAAAAAERAAAGGSSAASTGQSKITNFFTGPFRGAAQAPPPAVRAAGPPVRAAGGGRQAAAALQQGMSEDEALAAALAASMQDVPGRGQYSTGALSQEDEDRLLAQAIQESERESGHRSSSGHQSSGQQNSNGQSCVIS